MQMVMALGGLGVGVGVNVAVGSGVLLTVGSGVAAASSVWPPLLPLLMAAAVGLSFWLVSATAVATGVFAGVVSSSCPQAETMRSRIVATMQTLRVFLVIIIKQRIQDVRFMQSVLICIPDRFSLVFKE
jgi:hypothetical protein